MFGTFFQKKKIGSRLVLTLDIRSSSIGGAVSRIYEDNRPIEIISSIRDFFYFDEITDTDSFVTRAEISLNKVLDQLIHKEKYTETIESVNIFYGAPWYKNLIENFKTEINAARPILFTKKYLDKILKNTTKELPEDQMIIDRELLAIFLNGYYTKNPFDKEAKSVDLSFYFAVLNDKVKNNVTNIIKKFIKVKNINHHSHTIAFYNLLKNVIHPPESYVMLDISGEVTEISIIKHEHLLKIISVPHGNSYFVRKMMAKTGHDFMTCLNEMKTKNKLLESIAIDEWRNDISKEVIASKIHSLPSTVYVSTADETRNFTRDLLSNIEVYFSTLKMHKKPELVFIGGNLFKKRILNTKSDARDDAHMMSNILYVELLSKRS